MEVRLRAGSGQGAADARWNPCGHHVGRPDDGYPKDRDNKEEKRGWKYTIDPSKDPKEMDWFVEETPGRSIHQPAIYVLDGATLKICSAAQGKPRPTKFESKRGDFGGLWVLERVAPKTKVAGK